MRCRWTLLPQQVLTGGTEGLYQFRGDADGDFHGRAAAYGQSGWGMQ